MKKVGKFATALVVMAAAIGMMGCAQPSGGGSSSGAHVHTWTLTADTATYLAVGEGTYTCTCGQTKTEATEMKAPVYQFTESVQVLAAGTNGTAGTSATYVLFGDWPQPEAAAGITYRAEPESNGYYVGSDGNYYAKTGTKYYRVEPIKWRVLDTAYDYDGSTGSETAKLLLAENILTSNVPFYEDKTNNRTIESKTIYPNNYKHSQIRAYLNGLTYQGQSDAVSTWNGKGFLQTAFTEVARNNIKTTEVDNSEDSLINFHKDGESDLTKKDTNKCDNTNDKIFLLSEYEVTKYSTELYTASSAGNSRIRKTTAYAVANGAWKGLNGNYGGYWWLRSPHYNNYNQARNVSYDGPSAESNYVNFVNYGVVPALAISF